MVEVEALVGQKYTVIRREARAFVDAAPPDAVERAVAWYGHPAWEVRIYAVLALGGLAAADERALAYLYEHCGDDPSWQVNEGLAMALDDYRAAIGCEAARPVLEAWLRAPRPNLRRAVSEGLRPWTASRRAYFVANPQRAIDLLGTLRDDESRYVQESVGNALRDISRKHFDLVLAALRAWHAEQPSSRPRRTIARFALERAVKDDPTLRALYE